MQPLGSQMFLRCFCCCPASPDLQAWMQGYNSVQNPTHPKRNLPRSNAQLIDMFSTPKSGPVDFQVAIAKAQEEKCCRLYSEASQTWRSMLYCDHWVIGLILDD